MNSQLFDINLKQTGIALLAAVLVAVWAILSPALDSAIQTGVLTVNWSIVLFSAIKAFCTTFAALFLTDEHSRPLGIGKKNND